MLQAIEVFMVRQNNDICWNSTDDMIKYILELWSVINHFIVVAITNQGASTSVCKCLDNDQLTLID
jgi:hypothetical protein